MRRRTTALPATLLAATVLAACASGGPSAPRTAAPSGGSGLPSIASTVAGLEAMDGFLPLYWDEAEGKLWLEIPALDTELLYIHALAAGIGSNDIGLDRTQLGSTRVVEFQRTGRQVFMVEPNYDYRADTDNEAERRSVEDAFAHSILWGFTVEAESDGRVLVDATDFALRDVHGVADQLRRAGQGSYQLDRSRSAVYLPRTRAFPRNTELEVTLTFQGDPGGGYIRSVTPSAEAVTVRQRHSFVASPEPGFEPRRADPRAGFFSVSWLDYAAPLGAPMRRQFIARHRLEKRNPDAAMSEPVEPIVYYLDPGVPEPVRSALLEGGRWWNQAFEAAGYRNAFRVEVLPDTADPLDVRYNVINWVHRSTRGWSYGSSVTDPRTGEIIKGHVQLGSLRVRQDYLLAEGLLSPYQTGTETPDAAREMALARIRQLSAHEIGHTLGLAHNFLASTADRASVMDYPHPLARLTADGRIDLSAAYDEGIGEWDKVAVRYGYTDFPAGTDEEAALDRILTEGRERGLYFLSDQDARAPGSAHPGAHLWDNGLDAAAELRRMLDVRRAALERFGASAIQAGRPLATLEEALVPLYLHHRYQLEAASKVLGGQYYTYAIRGDEQVPVRRVPEAEQVAALDALLETLSPEQLALPRSIVSLIPPRPYGYPRHRELFDRYTGITFDPIAPAGVAAELTLGMLLNPQRAARLVEQAALNPGLPGLGTVLDRLVDATFGAASQDGYEAEIARLVQDATTRQVMTLASTADMPQVRAMAELTLRELRDELGAPSSRLPDAERAHRLRLAGEITRYLERPAETRETPAPLTAPPGSPIGGGYQPHNGTKP
ncbi:MAG TPA: zinc-dependent metalloprotease [Longimicrobiales bacterium]|nr:zinc-dependent metalloprotease [Longimicrobiales bacterium]